MVSQPSHSDSAAAQAAAPWNREWPFTYMFRAKGAAFILSLGQRPRKTIDGEHSALRKANGEKSAVGAKQKAPQRVRPTTATPLHSLIPRSQCAPQVCTDVDPLYLHRECAALPLRAL